MAQKRVVQKRKLAVAAVVAREHAVMTAKPVAIKMKPVVLVHAAHPAQPVVKIVFRKALKVMILSRLKRT